jgi:hypothetical protein
MPTPAVVVFTARTVEQILAEGGTSAWKLHPDHARARAYCVCTRNSFARWSKAGHAEPHRAAFLVGKIANVVPALKRDKRYLIEFSEYALVNIKDVWVKGDRNPIKYVNLEDLEIDPAKLTWKLMPQPQSRPAVESAKSAAAGTPASVIVEAKQLVATAFGVPIESVEITVRA